MELSKNQLASRAGAICILLAVTPFLLACLNQTSGPRFQEVGTSASRGALAFDQYQVNLGDVAPARRIGAYFTFTNRGDQTIEIKQLNPSCGCLNPQLKKRIYKPGESGKFSLSVETANEKPGHHEYYVDVAYNDGQPRERRVTFKVNLPVHKVVISPKALVIYQLSDQKTRREIYVTDFRDQPLQILGVQCSSKLVRAEFSKTDRDSDGNYRSVISIEVDSQVPAGRHDALITVYTNDAEYPQLNVPMLIQGPKPDKRIARPPDRLRSNSAQ